MTSFSGTEQQTHLADSVGAHVRAQAAAETFEVPFLMNTWDVQLIGLCWKQRPKSHLKMCHNVPPNEEFNQKLY